MIENVLGQSIYSPLGRWYSTFSLNLCIRFTCVEQYNIHMPSCLNTLCLWSSVISPGV